MTIVGGFDMHRQQITFDYAENDGLVRWGQIRPRHGCPSCAGRRLRRPNAPRAAGPRIMPTTTSWPPNTTATTARTQPWRSSAKSCGAAITHCGSSAMPPWPCLTPRPRRWPPNHALRTCPAHTAADACGQLPQYSVATPLWGGLPGKNERPHPFSSPHVGHPIDHHVAGPSSVDPDKAGRRHTQREHLPVHGRPQMT
jgi:hypothetical protein